MTTPLERSAEELIKRPETLKAFKLEPLGVYSDLAMIATSRGGRDRALQLLQEGRQTESPDSRAKTAPIWDMLEIRIRAQTDDPTAWVADLAVVLERYRDDPGASQSLTMSLIDMGLIRAVPNPDRPGEVMIDSSPLQALLTEYGPRVTTASGRLGVSAAKPEIWTPGSQGAPGGSKGIWTPGSKPPAPTTTQQPTPGGPKLIIRGS